MLHNLYRWPRHADLQTCLTQFAASLQCTRFITSVIRHEKQVFTFGTQKEHLVMNGDQLCVGDTRIRLN